MGRKNDSSAKKEGGNRRNDRSPANPDEAPDQPLKEAIERHVDQFITQMTEDYDELPTAGKMLPDFLIACKRDIPRLKAVKNAQLVSTQGLGQTMYKLLHAAKKRV